MEYTNDLKIPKISLSEIEIENEDYKSYFESMSEKIMSDIAAFDETYEILGLDKIEYDSLDKKTYGDKVAYRDIYYKKSLCNACYDVLYYFIQKNDIIKTKFNEFRDLDYNADVFGKLGKRDDIEVYICTPTSKGFNNEKASGYILLMLKYIFAMRYTYKDLLYKVFPMLSKNQINYMLKKLENNNLIKTSQNMSTRITTIIPSAKLDRLILKKSDKTQMKFIIYEQLKNRTKNQYVIKLVESANPTTPNELEEVFKKIPDSMLYLGTERMLLSLSKTDSRYTLEYYYNKLTDIKNSMQASIRLLNISIQKGTADVSLAYAYRRLYKTLDFLLENCFYAIGSYGKFQDYANISLRSLASNGVYIYDISLFSKEDYLNEQHFKLLLVQATEDYRVSKVCNKSRDVIIYMSSNAFENDTFCDSFDICFYDDITRSKFLKNISSIKDRIKDFKKYYYSDTRSNLSKNLSKTLLV